MDYKLDHIDQAIKLHGYYYEVPFLSVTSDVVIGNRVTLSPFVNLFGCKIGDDTKIGAYTEIGRDVTIGNRCKIEAHCFLPTGITVGDEVFIGPGCTFTNDKYPKAVGEWKIEKTRIEDNVSIGARCTILPGITIGAGSFIAAGTVVTRNVKPRTFLRSEYVQLHRDMDTWGVRTESTS